MSMSLTRGGYAPLENAGEFVCDCLRDGKRVSPRWGKSVHEQVVRCRDCKHGRSPQQGFPWMCIRNCCAHFPIEPDGFCAWGVRKED